MSGRGLAVLVGGLLAVVGVLLLVPLPEVGLPALLGGLRLLGRRYAWARAANTRVDAVARSVRARFRRLPRPVRVLALLAGALVLVATLGLTVRHTVA